MVFVKFYIDKVPRGKPGSVLDVANAVVFLASEKAS